MASQRAYVQVSGLVFGLIAIGQGVRAIRALPVQVGAMSIPVWVSGAAALAAALLCVWAIRSARS